MTAESRPKERLSAATLRELWSGMTDPERVDLFRLLSQGAAHDFFTELPSAGQAMLVETLPEAEARIWIRLLAPDDVADLISSVPEEKRDYVESLLDQQTLEEARALLAYEEDEAGGLMNPRFARVRSDVVVEVAIRYLRRQTRNNLATSYYAYVLDSEQRLLGVVSFRELFAARGDVLVESIMRRDLVTVREDAAQELVASLIAQHNLMAIPVLDADGKMRGVVTVDDVIDVVTEEATKDIQKLGGSEALGAPYLSVSLRTMVKKRGVWLSVLFFGEMLTATAMGYFEGELSKAVVLAMFVPLIISSGGNTGSQASTLVVRALALEELRLRDWFRVLKKELAAGLALGLWLGFLGFIRVVIWHWAGLYDYGVYYFLIALTVWMSLLGVVMFGTVTGSMLPFFLRSCGLDPAVSSTPFVATLVDVTGLVIYFLTAAIVLGGTIL